MDTAVLELLVVAVLIFLNGFFACAEFAVISIRKSRVAQLVAEGDERAVIVDELQRDPHRLLAIIQIGVTVIGSTASAVGGIVAVKFLKPVLLASPFPVLRNAAEPLSVTAVVAVISYLLLIIGELVPKTLGLQYADPLALQMAKPLKFVARVTGSIVWLLTISSRAVFRILGIKGENRPFISREEIQHIVAEGHESGIFSASEQEYIKNIFDFTHTAVREVMVPRTRIVALNLELPLREMVQAALENMYSRYPVYRGSIENIVGFIHGKDLFKRMIDEKEFDVTKIIRPPHFVPEGKKVNELLKEMQKERTHMALVVDEYGGLSGLVTTEDLLEELVGEIEDEHDVEEADRIQRLPDGSFLVDALLSIYDVEDLLGVKIEDDVPYDTIAGLILDRLGRFPRRGERIEWKGFMLECIEVKKTAIVRVRIAPL